MSGDKGADWWRSTLVEDLDGEEELGIERAAKMAMSVWDCVGTRICAVVLNRPLNRLAVSPPCQSAEGVSIEFRELKPGQSLDEIEPTASGWEIYGPWPNGVDSLKSRSRS